MLATLTRGEGLPIVCLPYFALPSSVTATALEPALGRGPGLRRIYVDLPGTGRSPAGPATSDGVLDLVEELIDSSLGAQPFLLAGCSYGGYLAAGLTRRRGRQVAGLLLVCTGPRILPADRDLGGVVPAALPAGWLSTLDGPHREHLETALGEPDAGVARTVAALLVATAGNDDEYLARLRGGGYQLSDESVPVVYEGPTSIVAGRADRIGGYADMFRALSRYPNAGYTVLSGAGHYLPFERPAAFTAAVTEWLRKALPRM